MKPLIIGEAPSKNEDVPQPIAGRVGRRLAECAGLTMEEFLAHFDRVNLLKDRQDTDDHGFTFDHARASLEAYKLREKFTRDQIVLLLGWRVARAFSVPKRWHGRNGLAVSLEYFVQYNIGDTEARIVPHPSGVNRWWNDPANYKQACEFMQNIVRRTR